MKNVEQILTDYLKSVGADGFCKSDGCKCHFGKGFLVCWGGIDRKCTPARSHTVTEKEHASGLYPGYYPGLIVMIPLEDNDNEGKRDQLEPIFKHYEGLHESTLRGIAKREIHYVSNAMQEEFNALRIQLEQRLLLPRLRPLAIDVLVCLELQDPRNIIESFKRAIALYPENFRSIFDDYCELCPASMALHERDRRWHEEEAKRFIQSLLDKQQLEQEKTPNRDVYFCFFPTKKKITLYREDAPSGSDHLCERSQIQTWKLTVSEVEALKREYTSVPAVYHEIS